MDILAKLKVKPVLSQKEGPVKVQVVLPKKQVAEIKLDNITFVDKRDNEFNIEELNRRLQETKLAKVTVKKTEPEKEKEEMAERKKTKVKRTTVLFPEEKKLLTLIDEERGEEEREEVREGEETMMIKKRSRRTEKVKRGVITLSPSEWATIEGESVVARLPPKQPNVIYKVPSYYMNNREIFTNFINGLFDNYDSDLMDDSKQITCDTIKQTSETVSLLTHQKIVRDYMNLYTPYRGLLLYHGLGAGKTLSSIAIAEGLKENKKVIILTPASLHPNYVSELKKGGDALYKLNQCWEWISTKEKPTLVDTLSSVLHLSADYINKRGGAWLVNVKKTKPMKGGASSDIEEVAESGLEEEELEDLGSKSLTKGKETKGKETKKVEEEEDLAGEEDPAGEEEEDSADKVSCTYDRMSPKEKVSLDEQITEMIESKYRFIHYNGLRRSKLKEMTSNFTTNLFDNTVVVIDEAHNFISRIVNKIEKEKEIPVDRTGKKESVPISLAVNLYEMLMSAKDARVVLLTGTPIINYPNEIGILFNILRGYIKTWEFPLNAKGVTLETISEILRKERNMDYIEYSASSKKLLITRNPFGFENVESREKKYSGVSNEDRERRSKDGTKSMVKRGQIGDADFERHIIRLLQENNIEVIPSGIVVHLYKALPDKFDDFVNRFIDLANGNLKNEEMFKKRILGLTSYFRSAQEELLPRYEKLTDFHVIKIPMSEYQFGIYEAARKEERKQEKSNKTKKGKVDENGVFKEPSSTYRIFSRLYCNFVMPKPPGRPLPREEKEEAVEGEGGEGVEGAVSLYADALKQGNKQVKDLDEKEEGDGIVEGDVVIEQLADSTYTTRIQDAIKYVEDRADEYLSKTGLEMYSPKYLHMLENIQDSENIGLHLVYSQFRTLEGIGMFTRVLDQNGFTQFKIKKGATGEFEIDISEENKGKPTYALYTGTESTEEKETLRKIFNSSWNELPVSLANELKAIAHNNNIGEIIKVFMITASGSEGINLRNTRFVHIMEPYWHPVRMEQVIGRARRICSHNDLPVKLQTIEVFVYLMTFTEEQIKSDKSIELKQKDLSKKLYQLSPDKPDKAQIPFTSDEALFEISTMKEELSSKLLTAVKESSVDCAIHTKKGNKEQLHCLQFGQPKTSAFSYKPSIGAEEPDSVAKLNKEKITWKGKVVNLKGKDYIYRKMDETNANLYDLKSYQDALENPGVQPRLIGTLKKNEKGEQVFTKI